MPALVVAFVLMMVTTATLINTYAVSEEEAIDRSLAQMQAHWAMQGSMNYIFGRLAGTSLSGTTTADRIADIQGYAAESTASTLDYFAAAATLYRFNLTTGVATFTGGNTGELRLTFDLAGVTTGMPSVLAGITTITPPVVADICVGPQALTARAHGGDCWIGGGGSIGIVTINEYRRR